MANMKSLAVDAEAGEAGVWIRNIPNLLDIGLKVRAADCAPARRLRTEIESGTPQVLLNDPKTEEATQTRILSEVILLDWENVFDGDTPVPFSVEAAVRYLSDPNMKVFRRGVTHASILAANQSLKRAEGDAGN